MIATPFYKGQGIGNQLSNYVSVRCLALDKGYDFGVMYPENFKGSSFMKLDMGKPVIGGEIPVEGQSPTLLPEGFEHYYKEDFGRAGEYDPEFKNIKDNTLIHGNLQGEDYYYHRRDEIREWLKTEPLEIPDDLVIINFRGGEYKYVPEFFLPKSYWEEAMSLFPGKRFEVHTDDPEEAKKFFPDFPIIHDIGLNWRSVRYAKNKIISNSSFGFLPAWLGEGYTTTIAPRFWGRHNMKYWFLEQNFTSRFIYI